ncbi:hypothetical protein DEU56DRAFT_777677 [Suillus clintonianus]|uniref:uncharacterized protein n=1 Tax=Suillus clintonianus TaxID=1904413 RepID=UPI001B879335|nr:uncharacterized protein DEU56DRAFT_777677 [Suillus clintonianus]KAG2151396.1 hypothetical protein DEU56DRAFT_777677 [Suillus clintonianus]
MILGQAGTWAILAALKKCTTCTTVSYPRAPTRVLVQLQPLIEIPTDSSLPANISSSVWAAALGRLGLTLQAEPKPGL